jgi:hypothetical protein
MPSSSYRGPETLNRDFILTNALTGPTPAAKLILGVALQYTDSQFAIGPIIDERN